MKSAVPAVASPTGATSTAAMAMAMARPSSCAKWVPVRALSRMYAAQQAPARQGQQDAGHLELVRRDGQRTRDQHDTERRPGHRDEVAQPA